MYTFKSILISLSLSLALCSINVRRTGWLDRVVEYQKNRFIDDLMKQPVKITARIEKAPPGYEDSEDWDYESVVRLLTLIAECEGAAPVRRAFRRAMNTNRRFMSFYETFKAFPSLIKGHPNDFHYDVDSGEYYADVSPPKVGVLEPDDIIVVTNPVEAKLPSARISVELLKQIMESRAEAGRVMPTPLLNISWPVTPKRNATTKGITSTVESTTAVDPTSESTAEGSEATAEATTAAPPANDTTAVASVTDTAVNATSANATETS